MHNIPIPSTPTMQSDINMTYLCEMVGIPPEQTPHSSALPGAIRTAEIYNRMLLGKKFMPEFFQYPIPQQLQDNLGRILDVKQ